MEYKTSPEYTEIEKLFWNNLEGTKLVMLE
jgi:hypothetical protein